MIKSNLFTLLALAVILTLGWLGLSEGNSEAAPPAFFGITPTPTDMPTDMPTDTPTDTPTNTPTNTPVVTTPVPGPQITPQDTAVPTALTPVGTLVLPTAGQANPTPLWLLSVVTGSLLLLGAWLLRRSSSRVQL